MAAAKVKLIVGKIRPRNEIGNHGEAVGARCAGRFLNLQAVHQS